ncbi:aminotransferase class V-fold PLP-dependent enzyme [Mycoplasma parvum]|uniref:Aminotransferase class V domain-containing protein n=1 Tax=Mycoplasma parvum str. Indiana TaxID=1403316 RepID=U5NFC5_9MOLU|nr:aminotransferase class V-fold PLP-dependent enzyme [Mycoplasma parvum]AGX88839.1 hypothetical protein PRV_00315 [Mycoplasma parvum str. Indiana]
MIYFDNAATSLKFPFFWEEWCKSYKNTSWIEKKNYYKNSLKTKLSEFLGVNSQNIYLTPSSTYAINEIWEALLNKNIFQNIYLFEKDHISNISSILYKLKKDFQQIELHFLEHNQENYQLLPNSLLLVTVRDNLGLFEISKDIIEKIRVNHPSIYIIGDFNQYISLSRPKEEIFSLFDCLFFSAHKWFGPFGLAVISFKETEKLRFQDNEKYSLDWRSIYIWDKLFWKIQEEIDKKRQNFHNLKEEWEKNFPILPNLSYKSTKNSLIFLMKYKSEYFHDLIYWLEKNNIIFRSGDLCSNAQEKELSFAIRFSLSILNRIEEIQKLFELLKVFILKIG